MSVITQFGRHEHRLLSAKIQSALKEVCDEFGVDLDVGGGQIGGNSGRINIGVSLRDAGGTGVSGAEQAFRLHAARLGLKPEWFGKTCIISGKRFEIGGLNLNAPTYPILLKNIGTGKTHKGSVMAVCQAMGV